MRAGANDPAGGSAIGARACSVLRGRPLPCHALNDSGHRGAGDELRRVRANAPRDRGTPQPARAGPVASGAGRVEGSLMVADLRTAANTPRPAGPGCCAKGKAPGPSDPRVEVPVGGEVPAGHRFKIWSGIGDGANVLDLTEAIDAGAKLIDLHSPGGDHATAAGLASLIAEHALSVECHSAESAAVLVLAAGKRRTLAANGWIGLHRVWTACAGGSDELAAAAEHCRRLDDLYAQALERWSSWTAEQWLEAMRAGRVLDAEQALAAGLIDRIGPASDRLAKRPERIE
ncbi:MAG: hypothetical protein FKY71_14750, partial [Spiribacter salinus]